MKFHLFAVLEEVLHETSTAVGEKKKKRSIRTANLFYLILMRRKTKKKYNQAWVYTLPIILWKFDRAGLVWSASLGAAAFLLLFLVLLWPEIDT